MNRFYLIIKITLLFFFIILSSVSTLNAQQSKDNFWDSVRFGGGIGLSFGDGFF